MKEKTNKLVIIARYQEKLDWVEQLKHDFVIYNKGNDWPYKFYREDVENQGREPETYLRAIIEKYEELHKYDFTVFLQGDPFDHCNVLLECLDNYHNLERFKFLCNETGNFTYDQVMYFGKNSLAMIDCLLTGNYAETSGAMKTLFLINLFGIKIANGKWDYACGAQYIVPTSMILKKPKEWWINIYSVYHFYCRYEQHDPSHIMEFAWPVLWVAGSDE